MLPVAKAIEIVSALPVRWRKERVPTVHASGFTLAQDVKALISIPSFDTAAMDGYLVRSEDLKNASPSSPVVLEVKKDIAAGRAPAFRIARGETATISTGAMLASGGDAVVEKELVRRDGRKASFFEPVPLHKNIRRKGESIRRGDVIMKKGTRISPFHVGLLCQAGVERVTVFALPGASIVTTGDEVISVGAKLSPAKVYDTSSALVGLCLQAGAQIKTKAHVKDSQALLGRALSRALEEDVVITVGGISAGEHDFVRPVLKKLGVKPKFFRVRQKPGKPLYVGTKGETVVFGLPGNPLSSLVCFFVYVRPFLQRLAGRAESPEWTNASLLRSYRRDGDRAHLSLAVLKGGQVEILQKQPSYSLRPLAEANALALFSEERSIFPKGFKVPVLPLEEWQTGFFASQKSASVCWKKRLFSGKDLARLSGFQV